MEPQHEKNETFTAMLDEFKHQFKSYVSTCCELYSLKAVQKISLKASSIVVTTILAFLVIFLLIFASVGTAFWLNGLLASSFCGFFIVAGFYAVLTVLVFAFRKKWMRRRIQDTIIYEMLND